MLLAAQFEALRDGPWLIFVFALGACVGSFVNVVNWRMPAGMSLSKPPSRCPTCGGRLRFLRENTPILGWIALRGRCRFCSVRISPIYPIVEAGMGLAFVGLYVLCFMTGPSDTWWYEVTGPWWARQDFLHAWPAWILLACLAAGLFSMTVIDARTFTIPLGIPLFIIGAAFLLWPVQGVLARPIPPLPQVWPIPGVGWTGLGVGLGGLIGSGVSCLLLVTGRLRPSFHDYADYIVDDEPLAEYPHARREMGVECVFLLPVVAGMVLGGWGLSMLEGAPPVWLGALGGSLLGWLVGCGLVWGVRIVGTLAFGREAMGLGDVHLLGAIGAVLGWFVPIVVFFVAPFIGLAWTVVASLAARVGSTERRELPYGPHLALATVLVVLGRPWVLDGWHLVVPTVPLPANSLVSPVDKSAGWTFPDPAGSMQIRTECAAATDGTTVL